MGWRKLIPEMMREVPPGFELSYLTAVPIPLPPGAEERVAAALRSAGVAFTLHSPGRWRVEMPWRTLVFGLIAREMDEEVVIVVDPTEEAAAHLVCLPRRTHEAHAVGLAAVLMIAVTVWLVGGWWTGLPAAFTCLAGGVLWVAYTRELAWQGLERRLRRLLADVGTAVWPRLPARVLPPPAPGLGRMDM